MQTLKASLNIRILEKLEQVLGLEETLGENSLLDEYFFILAYQNQSNPKSKDGIPTILTEVRSVILSFEALS